MQQFQSQQQRPTPSMQDILAAMQVKEPFKPKEKKPYDGPTGPFLLEIVKMHPAFLVQDQYQNEQGNRARAPFEFEIVGDARGAVDEAFGRIVNPDGTIDQGHRLTVYYNVSTHEKSKLRPLLNAAFGGQLAIGQQLTPEALEGLKFFATITTETSETEMVEVPVLDVAGNDTGVKRNVPMVYPALSGFLPYDPAALSAPRGRLARQTTPVTPNEDQRLDDSNDVPF